MALSFCESLPPSSEFRSSPLKLYKTVGGFVPSHDGELELRPGDIVASVRELGNGWSLGKNENADSRVGIFPSRCVRPLPTYVAIPKVPHSTAMKYSHEDARSGVQGDRDCAGAPCSVGRRQRADVSSKYDDVVRALSRKLSEHAPSEAAGRVRTKIQTYETVDQLPSAAHFNGSVERFNVGVNRMLDMKHVDESRQEASGSKPHLVVKPNQDKLLDGTLERLKNCEYLTLPDIHEERATMLEEQIGSVGEEMLLTNRFEGPTNSSGLTVGRSASLMDVSMGYERIEASSSVAAQDVCAIRPSVTLMDIETARSSAKVRQSPPPLSNRQNASRSCGAENKRCCSASADYRALNVTSSSSSSDLTGKHKPILKPRKVGDSRAQHLYYSDSLSENTSCRLVVCISTGLLTGLVMFLWEYYHLGYSFTVSSASAVAAAVLLGLSLSLSRMVRCVASLLLPSVCTARGRAAFTVFLFGFLLSGPVGNVYENMAEISRSMSCSAEQSYRQTILLLEPFDAMMEQLNRTIVSLQEAAHNVSRGLDPLDRGLERVEIDVSNGKIQLYGTRKVIGSYSVI